MYIKSKELNKLLKEKGRNYVLTMYINYKIRLTSDQLEKVYNYE